MRNGMLRIRSNRCCVRFLAPVSSFVTTDARREVISSGTAAVERMANSTMATRTSTMEKPASRSPGAKRRNRLLVGVRDTSGQPFDRDGVDVGPARSGDGHRALARGTLGVEVDARAGGSVAVLEGRRGVRDLGVGQAGLLLEDRRAGAGR